MGAPAGRAQLLADAELGIRLCEHIEDVNGAVVFRAACNLGLEGIIAKRRDSRYRFRELPRVDQDQKPGACGNRAGDADRIEQAASGAIPQQVACRHLGLRTQSAINPDAFTTGAHFAASAF
jgi:hypothetical protein